MDNEHDEFNLAQFNEDYAPQGMPLRPEDLVIGSYSAVIKSVKLDRVKTGKAAGDTVAKWMLVILDGPAAVRQNVEHTSWLNTPAKVGQFGGELLILGIDTASWVPPDRLFSRMLPAALLNLAGKPVQFRVTSWMHPTKGVLQNQLRFTAAPKTERHTHPATPWTPAQMPDQSSLPF